MNDRFERLVSDWIVPGLIVAAIGAAVFGAIRFVADTAASVATLRITNTPAPVTNSVPVFSEAHDAEFGPAERVGTYVLCVRTVTNVVSGDNCVLTTVVRYETYITDQGIRLTRERGIALPRRIWKLESEWKEVTK